MAETPKLVSSMGKAELDRIFVRGYDLNEQLLGKITFAQMVYLMLVGRMPSAEEGRMIDTMLIVLVDHGMTTGALAARMTYHSAPEALQGAVAAAILGAGSVHLGSSEYCAKMLNDRDLTARIPKKPISTPSPRTPLKNGSAISNSSPASATAFTPKAIPGRRGSFKWLRRRKSTAATAISCEKSASSPRSGSAAACP